MADYEVLGDGTYSVVYACYHRETGERRAVKIVSNRVDCSSELQCLILCQGHENIIKLFNVYSDKWHTYIVTECLYGGELPKGIYSEDAAKLVIGQIASALLFMHKKGITHRDVKPENILVEKSYNGVPLKVKFIDFGFARYMPTSGTMKARCHSWPYGAPEILRPDGCGYDSKVDMWSLGVLMHMML